MHICRKEHRRFVNVTMAATASPLTFESGHNGMVHDAQLDYYGRRLATCSSDTTIKLFDIVGDQRVPIADLTGHEGPVWQVAWAHPSFGSLLASCSFDHRIIIWKETHDNHWTELYRSPVSLHSASVNGISWAPYESGLILACASSDGSFSTIEYKKDGTWETSKADNAHAMGCTAVSWAPALHQAAMNGNSLPAKRVATSGCDKSVKVWVHNGSSWQLENELQGHTDWVRDVAWAPNDCRIDYTVASAGQDGKVFVWSYLPSGQKGWTSTLVTSSSSPVWRVSWSTTGSILAVADGSGIVSLWKQALDGTWQSL